MGVKFEIKGGFIKTLVKAIENIHEECVWGFDSRGLHIQMSDVYKHKMLELNIDSEDLESYHCDSPVDLGIIIDRMKDVTKTLKVKDILSFYYETDSSHIVLKANGLSRSIKLIDTNMVGKVHSLSEVEKELSGGYSVSIDSEPFNTFLKAASKAISFDVVTRKDSLNVNSKTDEGLIEVSWDDITMKPFGYNSLTNYSVNEVAKSTSTMKGLVKIRGCQDGVLEITWDIANNSNIRTMVAPRV